MEKIELGDYVKSLEYGHTGILIALSSNDPQRRNIEATLLCNDKSKAYCSYFKLELVKKGEPALPPIETKEEAIIRIKEIDVDLITVSSPDYLKESTDYAKSFGIMNHDPLGNNGPINDLLDSLLEERNELKNKFNL